MLNAEALNSEALNSETLNAEELNDVELDEIEGGRKPPVFVTGSRCSCGYFEIKDAYFPKGTSMYCPKCKREGTLIAG